MDKKFLDKIYEIVEKKYVFLDEPMKKHTTFRVGGNADVYVDVAREEIEDLIHLCKSEKIDYIVLGNGSNVLVSDKGIRGVTISIGNRMNSIKADGDMIFAQAGALLSKVANFALKNSLEGMEFAAGIPGSIGGAVLMNAGAYGGEMKDVLTEVEILDKDGHIKMHDVNSLNLSYRHSKIMDKGGIILGAKIKLYKGNEIEIKNKMNELSQKRIEKQPLNFPSAGSTFKRPEGYFAGKLIEDSGLRGYKVGGAMVSEKHCGFVINYDNASASDIRNLMNDVSDKVYEMTSVRLEPEVRMIGEF